VEDYNERTFYNGGMEDILMEKIKLAKLITKLPVKKI